MQTFRSRIISHQLALPHPRQLIAYIQTRFPYAIDEFEEELWQCLRFYAYAWNFGRMATARYFRVRIQEILIYAAEEAAQRHADRRHAQRRRRAAEQYWRERAEWLEEMSAQERRAGDRARSDAYWQAQAEAYRREREQQSARPRPPTPQPARNPTPSTTGFHRASSCHNQGQRSRQQSSSRSSGNQGRQSTNPEDRNSPPRSQSGAVQPPVQIDGRHSSKLTIVGKHICPVENHCIVRVESRDGTSILEFRHDRSHGDLYDEARTFLDRNGFNDVDITQLTALVLRTILHDDLAQAGFNLFPEADQEANGSRTRSRTNDRQEGASNSRTSGSRAEDTERERLWAEREDAAFRDLALGDAQDARSSSQPSPWTQESYSPERETYTMSGALPPAVDSSDESSSDVSGKPQPGSWSPGPRGRAKIHKPHQSEDNHPASRGTRPPLRRRPSILRSPGMPRRRSSSRVRFTDPRDGTLSDAEQGPSRAPRPNVGEPLDGEGILNELKRKLRIGVDNEHRKVNTAYDEADYADDESSLYSDDEDS